MSFFSRAFPSGNFSPKHMLMVYCGDPPWFSLNCLSSEKRRRVDAVQRARRPAEGEEEGSRRFPPTVNVLLKAEQLHHGILRQLPGVGVGHVGIAGAGKHVAPVLPPGVDTSVLDLQQQTILDAPQDTVGVFNLIRSNNNAIIEELSRGKLNTTLVMDELRLMGDRLPSFQLNTYNNYRVKVFCQPKLLLCSPLQNPCNAQIPF